MSSSFKDKIFLICTGISLTETEDSWEKICKSVVSFSELIRASSTKSSQEIISTARELHRSINSAMKSERTRLSGPAIDLISIMASELGTDFEPLLHLFFPTLLSLCARTNKVVVGRARKCAMSVIETTQLVAVVPYLLDSMRDKSVSLRTVAAECTLACLNSLNPPDLEKEERTKDIEALIKMSIRDANAEVRKIGKQIYQAYELLLPNRAESFAAPLTPTSKKYLGLISRPKSALELDGQSHSLPHLSSSLSRGPKLNIQPPKIAKKVAPLPLNIYAPTLSLTQTGSHIRPAADNSTSRSRPNSVTDVYRRPTKEDKPAAHSTQHIPVRHNLPLSRSESAATTIGHVRSTSASLLTHSASSQPTNVSAAPQRILVNPPPDVHALSKLTSGPVRIDLRAGRNLSGFKKTNGSSSHNEGGLNRTESKKTQPSNELKEETRKEASHSLSNHCSVKALHPIQKPPNGGNGQNSKDAPKKITSSITSSTLSEAGQLPRYAQPVASSRARAVSASTAVDAIARRTTSTTRTISSSTSTGAPHGVTKPPATRDRTVSSTATSTSAVAATVVRSRGVTASNSTDAITAHSSIKSLSKPIWGSSSNLRSAAPLASGKRGARSDVATNTAREMRIEKQKQKRPSVVPEESDEVLVPTVPRLEGSEDAQSADALEVDCVEDTAIAVNLEQPAVNTDSTQSKNPEAFPEGTRGAGTETHEVVSPMIDFTMIQGEQSTQTVAGYLSQGRRVADPVNAATHTSNLSRTELSPQVISHMHGSPVVFSSPPKLPETPVRKPGESLDLHPGTPIRIQTTPISALLSSIQRGFLFTPATPLSPPDSYLLEKGGGLPSVPFPLFSNISARAKASGSEATIDEHIRSLDWKPSLVETADTN